MPDKAPRKKPGIRSFWPRRARGPRLYLPDGTRLLDLWLDGGRAILGHKCEGILLAYKNTAERGLTSPWPAHPLNARAKKTLEDFFAPLVDHPVALFCRDSEQLARAVTVLGATPAPWRPWLGPALKTPPPSFEGVIQPVLPLSLPGLPPVLLVSAALYDGAVSKVATLSDNPLASVWPAPALLAAIIRAFEILERSGERDIRALYPRLAAFLDTQDGAQSSDESFPAEGAGTLSWCVNGSWLHPEPAPAPEHWDLMREDAFGMGVFLPPYPGEPLAISPGFSDGEIAILVRLLSAIQGSPCMNDAGR